MTTHELAKELLALEDKDIKVSQHGEHISVCEIDEYNDYYVLYPSV